MTLDLSESQFFTARHDVYPLVDPAQSFAKKTYKDLVVIATGGSAGVGFATALFYAKAGAKVIINGRNAAKLDAKKIEIEQQADGAEVLTVAGDISEAGVGKKVVQATVEEWGKLDVVVANSGIAVGGTRFHEQDVAKWWYVQEVNVRGALNIIHAAIPELLKTKGQIIVSSSELAHVRFPPLSDLSISKHTINRFIEILALDYPELTMYAVHPGIIMTEGAAATHENVGVMGKVSTPDTVELAAATYLWLTARNAEFLNGRYVEATWDLGEVLEKKDEIVKENLLVTKLAGPKLA